MASIDVDIETDFHKYLVKLYVICYMLFGKQNKIL